jgi:hypothetical protein
MDTSEDRLDPMGRALAAEAQVQRVRALTDAWLTHSSEPMILLAAVDVTHALDATR